MTGKNNQTGYLSLSGGNLSPQKIAFKNERINSWLEDLLVTTKRAELMTAIRKAYRAVPSDKQQAFIDALDETTKKYIARDVTYMDIIRFGETIRITDPFQDQAYVDALNRRRKTLPRDRNTILNPASVLVKWRHLYNHPESEDMPEPPKKVVAKIFDDVKAIFNDAFYPQLDFNNTKRTILHDPKPSSESEETVLWHPGKLIEGAEEAPTPISPERYPHLYHLAYVSSRCRSHGTQFKSNSFPALLERAIDFRQVRVGALVSAINLERFALGESPITLISDAFTKNISEMRKTLAHEYETSKHLQNIFLNAEEYDQTISNVVLGEMARRHFTPRDIRLKNIPDPETLVSATLNAIGVKMEKEIYAPPKPAPMAFTEKPTEEEPLTGKRRFLNRRLHFSRELSIATAFKNKLNDGAYAQGGNGELIFSFMPKADQKEALLEKLHTFVQKHSLSDTEIDVDNDLIYVTVPAYERAALEKATKTQRYDGPEQPPYRG